MNVLITGESGFIGSHLMRALPTSGVRVEGLACDLTDASAVRRRFSELQSKPDAVVHLAAISHPRDCERNPERARQVNVRGTSNLVEALAKSHSNARIVFASTAQVYAPKTDGEPILESDAVAPINLYAQTKHEAEEVLRSASEADGLKTTVLRIFNHTHSSQPQGVFLTTLLEKLTRLKESHGETRVTVGNLDLWRDIGALSDLLSAFQAIISESKRFGAFDVVNVCNGHARLLRSLAEKMANRVGVQARFVALPELMRLNDPLKVVGSNLLLQRKTDWQPKVVTDDELIDSFFAKI